MGERAYLATVRGYGDGGVYWGETAKAVRGTVWRHFSDVFDSPFVEFARRLQVRRAPEFDGRFAGRQGMLPEYVSPRTAPYTDRSAE